MSRLEKISQIEKRLEDLEKLKQELLVELRSLRELPIAEGWSAVEKLEPNSLKKLQ